VGSPVHRACARERRRIERHDAPAAVRDDDAVRGGDVGHTLGFIEPTDAAHAAAAGEIQHLERAFVAVFRIRSAFRWRSGFAVRLRARARPRRQGGPMLSRRDALTTLAAAAPLAATTGALAADAKPSAGPAPGKHAIVPLPFDPKKLKGLSEKLITSHHENNYGG